MSEALVLLIVIAPLVAALINSLLIRPIYGSAHKVSAVITIVSVFLSFIISNLILYKLLTGQEITFPVHDLFSVGYIDFKIGVLIDGLAAIMLVLVSFVSFLVQVYSLGYMKDDPGYVRYYSVMSLFTSAMLLLVMSNNLVLTYAAWEIVGLSSYLLIGFWFYRPAAVAAAKKAFIVTRIGDFFFLLAIVGIAIGVPEGDNLSFVLYHPEGVNDLLGPESFLFAVDFLPWITMGIFLGAVGKSAQFPLHTWLPDAMEGPTPVSSLIHAATMVVAGVFLIARFTPLFTYTPLISNLVIIIGTFTVVFSATMALVMTDIKKVLAYSTVSQLGYMFVALGLGGLAPAIFHLVTHAFFKALLFLTAGSLNHSTGTFEMKDMKSVKTNMPWTHAFFLIGALGLAGVPPLAGFWSKDEILNLAFSTTSSFGQYVFWLMLVGAFLTSFYIFRAYHLIFHELNLPPIESKRQSNIHESPLEMLIPMAILSIFTISAGLFNLPWAHWITDLLHSLGSEHEKVKIIPILSGTVFSITGIVLSTIIYRQESRHILNKALNIRGVSFLHNIVSRKYYIDDLYENILVKKIFYSGISRFIESNVDNGVVDYIVNTVGLVGRNIGRPLSRIQSGQIQMYMLFFLVGITFLFFMYFIGAGE
jgi:NADH-quinone oxidoreductase subunit L